MRPRKNYKLPPVDYTEPTNGWKGSKQPKSDAYVTLITKHYEEDGHISIQSWYWYAQDLHLIAFNNGWLVIKKHAVNNGSDQTSYYASTEIVRVDLNNCSKEFTVAMEKWCQSNYGVSYDEWLDAESRSDQIFGEENLRKGLENLFGGPITFEGE